MEAKKKVTKSPKKNVVVDTGDRCPKCGYVTNAFFFEGKTCVRCQSCDYETKE